RKSLNTIPTGPDAAAAKMAKNLIESAVLSGEGHVAGDLPAWRQAILSARGNVIGREQMDVMEGAAQRALERRRASPESAYAPLVRPPAAGGPTIMERENFPLAEQQAVQNLVSNPPLGTRLLQGVASHLGGVRPTSLAATLATGGASAVAGAAA